MCHIRIVIHRLCCSPWNEEQARLHSSLANVVQRFLRLTGNIQIIYCCKANDLGADGPKIPCLHYDRQPRDHFAEPWCCSQKCCDGVMELHRNNLHNKKHRIHWLREENPENVSLAQLQEAWEAEIAAERELKRWETHHGNICRSKQAEIATEEALKERWDEERRAKWKACAEAYEKAEKEKTKAEKEKEKQRKREREKANGTGGLFQWWRKK